MTTTYDDTASWARRILALFVDWLACMAVAQLLVVAGVLPGNSGGAYTLLIYVLESALFTATLGGSFGKLLTRLRVVRLDGSGRPPAPLWSLVRSVLIVLVIPPLVFRPDGRGLHDMASGTLTVALRPRRGEGT